MSFLEDMAPAAAYQARKQFRRPNKRAAIRAAKAKRCFEEEQVRRQVHAWVVADGGGYIGEVLKRPHTNHVRGGQLVGVLRVEAVEGLGTAEGLFTKENPARRVVYWYEADGTLIARRDSWEERHKTVDLVAEGP